MGAWRVATLLGGAAIYDEIDGLLTNAKVVEERTSFRRRAVNRNLIALYLQLIQ
jgi:hypothetical protein